MDVVLMIGLACAGLLAVALMERLSSDQASEPQGEGIVSLRRV